MDIERKHFDAFHTYLRIGDLPVELDFIRRPALCATHFSVGSTFSQSWGEVFEGGHADPLKLPSNQQMVAVEDDISCVFLWDASDSMRDDTKTIGYLKCQRIRVDETDVQNSQESDDFEEVVRLAEILKVSISVDLGLINGLCYTECLDGDQFSARIFPMGYYVVDPETAQRVFIQQNAALLNFMFSTNPTARWKFIPEGQHPPFEPSYGAKTLESVIHALKHYALVSKS